MTGRAGGGEVSFRPRFEGRNFSEKPPSHNVVEAATHAYLQAANKAAYELKRLEERTAVTSGAIHENEVVDRFFPGGY